MDKKKKRKNKHSLVKILVCAGFLVYVGYTFITQQININNENAELKAINEQIAAENSRKEALAEEKETVNTPEYIEYYARTELGYAAPDEIVFIDSTAKD